MNEQSRTSSRSGGRAARRAARASALPEHLRPVRPGLEGGTLKPLTPRQVEQIHEAALTALETIGLADAPQSGIDYLVGAGCTLGDDGRIRFPRALVEDTIANANRSVTLHSRDGQMDLDLAGTRVHYGTAGAAVSMVDVHGREYRDSTVQDLHDAARICQQLDNIHFVQRPMVCRDITDNMEMDLNTVYAACSGTFKHIGTSFTEPSHVAPAVEMLHMIAGGEDKWRERPFVSNSNCFVVPPMKFATESCEVMEECIKAGMPVLLLSAGMAGATAPSTIAGAITQATAECLAGLVYVNAVSPGAPAVFGTWPFGLDLRTGAMSIGSGEQALLTAGCGQMHQFYDLPGGAAAGASDSKMPDMQAGWEQMCSNVMAGLSGVNMVYEAAGMHASLLGFCFESLILGDDIIGQAQRCVRGIEVTDETLALDQIAEVCMGGPGHYLGTDATLSRMQADYVYPTYGDRTSPKEWAELGKPDLIAKATARKEEILSAPSPARFDPMLDAALREKFNIHLPT
ncbi:MULTISPECIES: trimethylamine methyltransferase family protein [unclassified Ruegeria]|uniref:trimethylamine methyltransferase family protein n=1 Tax=unclassified Ruegeria TaxID=2625375 RepID=UPI001ADD163C|nr:MULTISPECIES: trimethylamine methyltransferase family protein [unclassified Ruegeria]MBO9410636.1 trimethylamine methyltransferase family protein [Ruegeria sp. R8_1]MBO9414145.1 trimethylamine methyltransferase family protein [Ruegeria sp. R8_2]